MTIIIIIITFLFIHLSIYLFIYFFILQEVERNFPLWMDMRRRLSFIVDDTVTEA